MDKKNNKGFLLGEETVNIIISVIAIIFLILFVVYLYNAFSHNSDLQNAKSSLTYLLNQINSGGTQATIYNPKNWWLESFPMNVKNVVGTTVEVPLPKSCSSVGWKNCLCICLYDFQASLKCDSSNAVCMESSFIVKTSSTIGFSGVNEILLNNPPVMLVINQTDEIIMRNQ